MVDINDKGKNIYENCQQIVVYGTGEFSREFLARYKTLPIIGVLDGYKKNGEFKGYPIIQGIEQAAQLGTSLIVVATSIAQRLLIYNRIKEKCRVYHIDIVDVNGNNLSDIFENGFWDYRKVIPSREILFNQIKSHDIISFDIFDTLLMRLTLVPNDVFDIVAARAENKGIKVPNFKIYRSMAEQEVLNHNHTLSGIYQEIQKYLDLDDSAKNKLKSIELDVESDVIIPRKSMVEVFQYARKCKKKICLTSDMYLPENFLRKILKRCNIEGFDEILISGYMGCTKTNGLFNILRQRINGNSYLHIGDNPIADGLSARTYGLDSVLISSGYEEWKRLFPAALYAANTVNDRSALGIYIAEMFNDPFLNKENIRMGSIYTFSKVFLGHLFTTYVLWLADKVKQEQIDAVLFAARDGYLLKKLYQLFCDEFPYQVMPKSIYFYTSRKSSLRLFFENNDSINKVIDWFGEEVLYESFKDKRIQNSNELIKKSKKERENYRKYLQKHNMKKENLYAFVDLLSSGTSQYFLQKSIIPNLKGFYFERHLGIINDNLNADAMLDGLDSVVKSLLNINEIYIFESIITSPEPTVQGFNDSGEPVFNGKTKNLDEKKWLNAAQQGIIDYFELFIKRLYVRREKLNVNVGIMLFDFHHSLNNEAEHKIFEHIGFIDDLSNKHIR